MRDSKKCTVWLGLGPDSVMTISIDGFGWLVSGFFSLFGSETTQQAAS